MREAPSTAARGAGGVATSATTTTLPTTMPATRKSIDHYRQHYKPFRVDRRDWRWITVKVGGLVLVLAMMALIGSLSMWRYTSMAREPHTLAARSVRNDGDDDGCNHIPDTDQCAYFEAGLCETGGNFNYLEFYYCTMGDVKWLCIIIFVRRSDITLHQALSLSLSLSGPGSCTTIVSYSQSIA